MLRLKGQEAMYQSNHIFFIYILGHIFGVGGYSDTGVWDKCLDCAKEKKKKILFSSPVLQLTGLQLTAHYFRFPSNLTGVGQIEWICHLTIYFFLN